MSATSIERRFLEEFLTTKANKRDHTPKTLVNLLKRGWIAPDDFDEGNFPRYVTTELGRKQLNDKIQ